MSNNKKVNWATSYDVVVIGFGGAGATAARFAADAGAKVLLIDKAPEGHEGGNTRYSGQLIASTSDAVKYKEYYHNLVAPLKLDDKILDVFIQGVTNMRDYLRKYLNVEPFSFKEHPDDPAVLSVANDFPDYPSYDGVEAYDMLTVHQGKTISDGALWTILRQKVLDRSDKIDVWYESPAIRLIQDENQTITGVEIERKGMKICVQATNGVVLTSGGFENDPERIQNWLGIKHLVPMGTLYNTGDSIRLAGQVGADMWHNTVYNAAGLFNGLTYKVAFGSRGILSYTWPQLYSGSIFIAGGDGGRYFNESEAAKEGYLYNNGYWRHALTPAEPYLIFDDKQLQLLEKIDDAGLQDALAKKIEADSPAALAEKLNFDSQIFEQTIDSFNHFAESGIDYEYHRSGETLTKINVNKLYAVALLPVALNTQGGPRRNEKAEILDMDGQPINHLYGAGEAGSITTNQYQAGQDLAECLIFGQIAGKAAAAKKSLTASKAAVMQSADLKSILQSDEDISSYSIGSDQYLGSSNSGMGDELVVRVTVNHENHSLQKVEILKESETKEIGKKALQELPAEMVAKNSTEVDAVSGATTTANALKEAVQDALQKIK